MPIIGGRYYANPSYGRALEEAREAGARNPADGAQDDARGERDDGAPQGRSARDSRPGARHPADDAQDAARSAGAAHHIHISREPRGIVVHVPHHAPSSDDAEPEPHGTWSTHTFAHGDHHAAAEFVKHQLARRA